LVTLFASKAVAFSFLSEEAILPLPFLRSTEARKRVAPLPKARETQEKKVASLPSVLALRIKQGKGGNGRNVSQFSQKLLKETMAKVLLQFP